LQYHISRQELHFPSSKNRS